MKLGGKNNSLKSGSSLVFNGRISNGHITLLLVGGGTPTGNNLKCTLFNQQYFMQQLFT